MEATKARSYLKKQVEESKQALKINFVSKNLPIPSVGAKLLPMSYNMTMHFSFDFAQQVGFN